MTLIDTLRQNGLKLSAALEITSFCNLDCVYCYQKDSNSPELNSAQWETVVILLDSNFQSHLIDYKFAGGEIFTKKDIIMPIKRAVATTANVTLVTNGVYIPEDFFSLIKKHRNNIHIEISLDGIEEIHDRFRGGFKKTISNVERICDLGYGLTIRSSVYRENSDTLDEFIDYMFTISDNLTFNFQPIFNTKPWSNITPLSLQEYVSIALRIKQKEYVKQRWRIYDSCTFDRDYRRVSKIASKIFGCEIGASVVVKPDGRFSPCEFHSPNRNILTISKEGFLHEIETKNSPNKKCTRCDVLEDCGGCRLAPLKHNYTATFGFNSCYEYINKLKNLR